MKVGKNKTVISIGNMDFNIINYISNKDKVSAIEINKEFNLNRNGTYLKKLYEKGFVTKIKRGTYKINSMGLVLVELLRRIKLWESNKN